MTLPAALTVCKWLQLQDEQGDMLLVDAAEGYEHLWRKVRPCQSHSATL
jgi:hypothetical protein